MPAQGHTDVLELLLEKGARLDVLDNLHRTPLLLAAGGGYADCTRVLLRAGAGAAIDEAGDPICVETKGRTPLLIAAARGHLEVRVPSTDVDGSCKSFSGTVAMSS
jgi:ankyrin repeat protein